MGAGPLFLLVYSLQGTNSGDGLVAIAARDQTKSAGDGTWALDRRSAVVFDGPLLQPSANGRFVTQILIAKLAFEESLFLWNHKQSKKSDRGNERDQKPKVIEPH